MIKAGIVGGAGYTGGELIRILLHHSNVHISFVHSNSNKGNVLSEVHRDLAGETDLKFSDKVSYDVDVLFLCMGHGRSKEFMEINNVPNEVKVIDLSHDFRIKDDNHNFIYGLPELQREKIKSAKYIANPGCFATAIELSLLPLAKENLLQNDVVVNAITGSTGAGQAPTPTSHFSWRCSNISVYKAFTHQHLAEIGQSIKQLQSNFSSAISFIPIRGNHTRGIFATSVIKCDKPLTELQRIYANYYAEHPFVVVLEDNPDLKQVVNTNKAVVYLEKHNDNVMIIGMIDNLLKGASGQAVQNMNLMFGLPENTGLRLKSSGF